MEELKVTGIADYRKKTQATKKVKLPSGAVFEIKKVTGRDFLREGTLPIQGTRDIVESEEKRKIWWDRLNPEQKKKQMQTLDSMICLAVVNPGLSMEKTEGKLCVSELTDSDYYALLSEITKFSFGGEDLKSFRDKSNTPPIRPNSQAIPPTPASDTQP